MSLSPSQSPYGNLGLLPPEIRAMIYALVFSAGSTALTRTSKALHAETQDTFHRYSVFRVYLDSYFEYPHRRRMSNSDLKYLKNVKNVRIRITPPIDFSSHWFYKETYWKTQSGLLKILRQFAEAMDKPKMCRVQFDGQTTVPFMWEIFDAMDWLHDFERVDVELSAKKRHLEYQSVDMIRQKLRPKEGSEGKPTVTVFDADDIDLNS